MNSRPIQKGQYDPILFTAVVALVIGSVIMVYSSSSVIGLTSYGSSAYFMKRQAGAALLGFALMGAMMKLDHRKLGDKRIVIAAVAAALVLMIATLIPGIGKTVNGAQRWIKLGGIPAFQPSEFAKIALVLYLSFYLKSKGPLVRDFVQGVLPVYLVAGIFMIAALLQPDFGTAVTIGCAAGIMLFAAGGRLLHLGGTLAAALPMVYIAVTQSEYRLRRILAFADPWADPRGSGHQIIQSFLAFGSGGIFGRGLGEGRQKLLFLPERHSDFIYAVIGEELGFIGALVVLALFLIILFRGVRIAAGATDPFSRMLAFGITSLVSLQALMNMAVVTGLMPTKGIALPLMSYGGTSLVATMTAIGVLLNISRETG